MRRVCVIGLDSLAPRLVFDHFYDDLPNLRHLIRSGISGPLESCIPPITVPAWGCLTTGVNPGALGIYGFRDRADSSYDRRRLASSLSFKQPPIWQLLSKQGLSCRVLGVPLTYPAKPLKGQLITGCLTPDFGPNSTYPAELRREIDALTDGYMFDVKNFRHAPKEALLETIYAMTDKRFKVARDWIRRSDWQFFMMVEMGPDRMHHAFWSDMASDHPAFSGASPHLSAIRDYYVHIDRHVGTLIDELSHDDLLMVVSDHGAQTMQGGIAINQWLMESGYLTLRAHHSEPTPLSPELVDWGQTQAWADGGYVGRLYLNIEGREPQGIVRPDEVSRLQDELAHGLARIPRPDGSAMRTQVLFPRQIYSTVSGHPPDLLVHFDKLAWRAHGTVGHHSIHQLQNDLGRDSANHAQHGVLMMKGPGIERARIEGTTLYDVAPTVLAFLGIEPPTWMQGDAITY